MKSGIVLALFASASVFGINAQSQTNAHPATPATSAASAATAGGSSRVMTQSDSIRASNDHTLRFESSWGSANIIQGADGPVVGTVGWFRGFDVEKLVESSPHAVAEAKSFQTNNFRGSLLSAMGSATLAIGIVVASNNCRNSSSPIVMLGVA